MAGWTKFAAKGSAGSVAAAEAAADGISADEGDPVGDITVRIERSTVGLGKANVGVAPRLQPERRRPRNRINALRTIPPKFSEMLSKLNACQSSSRAGAASSGKSYHGPARASLIQMVPEAMAI
jgi:hypothetical protein